MLQPDRACVIRRPGQSEHGSNVYTWYCCSPLFLDQVTRLLEEVGQRMAYP